jgi:hypothetical protein
VPNTGTHHFTKQTLLTLQAQVQARKMTVGDFNTPLSQYKQKDKKKKINKEP